MMTVFQAIFFTIAIGGYCLLALALVWRLLRGVLPTSPDAKQEVAGNPLQHTFAMKPHRPGGVVLLLMILLSTPLSALCQQDVSNSAEVLTLEQAIAVALRENHLLKNAELGVGKAGDDLAATRTIRLPSMHL